MRSSMTDQNPIGKVVLGIAGAVMLVAVALLCLQVAREWPGKKGVWVGSANYSELLTAVRADDVPAVNRILDQYPWMVDGPVPGDAGQPTPLHEATSMKRYGVARALLLRGADINAAITVGASPGYTPLDLAIFAWDLGMVKLLLANGADPRLTTVDGRTPEQLAEQTGCKDDLIRELRAAEKK